MADDSITVTVRGLSEINAALQKMPAALGSRILREALHAAGDVMLEAAEGTVPVLTGELKADIISRVYVSGDLLHGSVRVGPGYDRGRLLVRGTRPNRHRAGGVEAVVNTADSPGVYAKFVELGHQQGHRSGGAIEHGSGGTPPHPWLRPAFEESREAAFNTFVAYLSHGVQTVVNELSAETLKTS